MSFKEEAEELKTDQESGGWLLKEEEGEAESLSRESKKPDESSMGSKDEQDNLCMVLAEAKRRNQDTEVQTNPSSGKYNLDCDDTIGGEELEMIAASRKPFREFSCSSNITTSLESETDRKILSRIVTVKL